MERTLIFDGPTAPSGESQYLVVESCHSTWYFDVLHRRFRRLLRGFDERNPPATEWLPYFRIEEYPGSDSFVVWLNPGGTRLLRSWRHRPGCSSCAGRSTGEVLLPG